MSLAHRY